MIYGYVQVPILEQIEALEWLRCQSQTPLPRCYFSGRDSGEVPLIENGDADADADDSQKKLVSIAGLGSAVSFRQVRPFSLDDWHSIKRCVCYFFLFFFKKNIYFLAWDAWHGHRRTSRS